MTTCATYLVAENHVICKLKPNEAIPSLLGAFYTLDISNRMQIFFENVGTYIFTYTRHKTE